MATKFYKNVESLINSIEHAYNEEQLDADGVKDIRDACRDLLRYIKDGG